MTTPAIRYPAGPITPHGAYYLIKGTNPELTLLAYDKSIQINLMGGQAIPDRTMPESVQVKSIKGLIPPWQTIDQKGATEDGVTFLDALYDPIEIDANVVVRGRDAKHTRKAVRDLIAAIDAKKTSQLSWWTQELGFWWSDIRWFKAPPDELVGGQKKRQPLNLVWRADNGFWKSFDDVDQFRLTFDSTIDAFDYETDDGLGAGWVIDYDGHGGLIRADGQQALLTIDPDRPVLAGGRDVVCRRAGYTTTTDNQVIEITIGASPRWSYADGAYNDVWGRMANSGTPGANGVRLRVGRDRIRLSYFVNGVETVLREQPLKVQPLPGEKFALVCGYERNARMFKALRNGIEVQGMTVVESGAGSPLGVGNRRVGFGLHATTTIDLSPGIPASVRRFTAGDNAPKTQAGFLRRLNIGDQPRFDRFTFFGPGMFYVANGPGSPDFVRFGPLLPNQVMQVRSDPRARGVIDMTSVPPTTQEETLYRQSFNDFVSFAAANNVPMLAQTVQSTFGVQSPQGNPWRLLDGRFNVPLPAKSPGNPAEPQHIAVRIEGGDADSAVLAAGTPLRRYPS